MEHLQRTHSKGWVPDADEVNGPPDALLRADNLILDELGVLTIRQGSEKVNSGALSDTDIHSLFTVVRGGTRHRYAGANSAVYRNGSSILTGVNGSDDIFFGSHMGQTLIARGTTKRKDDGSTVRNLGIAMTGGAPAVQAALSANTASLAAWNAAETANHVIQDDDGSGLAYTNGHAGGANDALVLKANTTKLRGVVDRTYGGDQDFSQFSGPVAGADDDIFSMWIFVSNPAVVRQVNLLIDVNGGTFQEDYYYHGWVISDGGGGTASTGTGGGTSDPGDPGGGGSSEPPLI